MLLMVVPSGEVVLKFGRTREVMMRSVAETVTGKLARLGFQGKWWIEGARVMIETNAHARAALWAASRSFGVHSAAAIRCVVDFTSLEELAGEVRRCVGSLVEGRRFAVRTHRVGKHPFTSMDVNRVVGAELKPLSAGVDLEEPEVEVHLEVRGWRALVYTSLDVAEGPGGLPRGCQGGAVHLYSGGLDSPVAAWLIARRGVEPTLLHLTVSTPESAVHALTVGNALSQWLEGARLLVVEAGSIAARVARLPRRVRMTALKVVMYTVASTAARKLGALAISTGESIGQTSSQTLWNLSVIEAVAQPGLPVIRPLAGMDKEDVVELARRIGVYEVASRTPELSALALHGASPRVELQELRRAVDQLGGLDWLRGEAERLLEERSVELQLPAPKSRLVEAMPLILDYIPHGARLSRSCEATGSGVVLLPPGCEEECTEARRRGVHCYVAARSFDELPRVRVESGEMLARRG